MQLRKIEKNTLLRSQAGLHPLDHVTPWTMCPFHRSAPGRAKYDAMHLKGEQSPDRRAESHVGHAGMGVGRAGKNLHAGRPPT